MMRKTAKISGALALALVLGAGLPALAAETGLFAPKLVINGQVISNYEFDQRVKFLRVLRVPGDPEKEAMRGLTEDRLGAQEAKRLDLKLTEDQIKAGMAEFAGRANMDVPAFVKALNDEGVDSETFRDFVTAGLLWREVVRSKFVGRVRISDTQIDRALAEAARKPEVKLLLSELVIPVPPEANPADILAEAREIKANLGSEGGFAAAARTYSASPSAAKGGLLDWMPLSNLPPAIASQLVGLAKGEVSDPVVVPQAVVLFQLNGLQDMPSAPPLGVKVSYAQFTLPPGQDAAALLAATDGCADLYPIARKLGSAASLSVTEDAEMAAVPQDIGLELAKLDTGEFVIRKGGNEALMLCRRNNAPPPEATPPAQGEETAQTTEAAPVEGPATSPTIEGANGKLVQLDPERETVRNQLGNEQLSALADAYMEKLRSEAIIKTP